MNAKEELVAEYGPVEELVTELTRNQPLMPAVRDIVLAFCRLHDTEDATRSAERAAALTLLINGMRHLGDNPDRSTFADHRGWRDEVAAFLKDMQQEVNRIKARDEALDEKIQVVLRQTVVVQKWEESERGWGIRPDGYSVHPSEVACRNYIKGYWAGMPSHVPDEYSRPDGAPYLADTDDQELIARLKTDGVVRVYGGTPYNFIRKD